MLVRPCVRPSLGSQLYVLVENMEQSVFQPLVQAWLAHRAYDLGRSDKVCKQGRVTQNKGNAYVDMDEEHATFF